MEAHIHYRRKLRPHLPAAAAVAVTAISKCGEKESGVPVECVLSMSEYMLAGVEEVRRYRREVVWGERTLPLQYYTICHSHTLSTHSHTHTQTNILFYYP